MANNDEMNTNGRALPQAVLRRRDQQTSAWPLHNAAAAAALESHTTATLPVHALIQRAGLGVARLARAVAPQARHIWVLAGPGNNGGDGVEAAAHLAKAGLQVQVSFCGDVNRLPSDAAASRRRAQQAGVVITQGHQPPETQPDLVIDALLGRGLRRAVEGPLAQAIQALQACAAPVLAVDLPSGLASDTGAVAPDAACVRATWTLGLLSLAPGLFTAQGRDASGDIWFDDLQAGDTAASATAWLASGPSLDAAWPARQHSQHKGSFGDLWVVGGATLMGGAATLAARAALRSGAGRVYLARLAPDAASSSGIDLLHPELMNADLPSLLADPTALARGTTVAGCGAGEGIAAHLPHLLRHCLRLVLDADALNAIASSADLQTALNARATRGQHTVLTPHPLEAARLLGIKVTEVQGDRLGAAHRLAQQTGAVAVLKGSGTIVSAPSQTPWVIPVGNAALATPGSGDVLAGWLGGLWSQCDGRLSSAAATHWTPAQLAACRAVWQHGRMAELLRPCAGTLPASELAEALGRPAQR